MLRGTVNDAAAPSRLATRGEAFRRSDARSVEWIVSDAPVAYAEALAAMEARAQAIAEGSAGEAVWLLEHPALLTAGTGAADDRDDAGAQSRLPLHRTGRGGQVTYHGPGQRVAYCMLDLDARRRDVRAYVAALEAWITAALARFGLRGERREDRVGIWIARPDKAPAAGGAPAEDKIAAIGIRVRRWVAFHGLSLNVEPDLSHYAGIVPCGIDEAHLGVTSLADLDLPASMAEVDMALRGTFEPIFGPTHDSA